MLIRLFVAVLGRLLGSLLTRLSFPLFSVDQFKFSIVTIVITYYRLSLYFLRPKHFIHAHDLSFF